MMIFAHKPKIRKGTPTSVTHGQTHSDIYDNSGTESDELNVVVVTCIHFVCLLGLSRALKEVSFCL